MATVENKQNVKYEGRAVGKLIAFVSNYKLARFIAGIYMMFSNETSVHLTQIFPWEESFENDPHVSILNPRISAR